MPKGIVESYVLSKSNQDPTRVSLRVKSRKFVRQENVNVVRQSSKERRTYSEQVTVCTYTSVGKSSC
jgi:hypothetical protein